MNKKTIRFKSLKDGAQLPAYQTEGAAGADIRACIGEDIIILEPGHRTLVPTGLSVEIPQEMQIEVRPRSGLALKHGVTVLNAPGTIDSDYRGELMVMLVNMGDKDFTVKTGERIAQIVFTSAVQQNMAWTTKVSKTSRGSGGFGSTGV